VWCSMTRRFRWVERKDLGSNPQLKRKIASLMLPSGEYERGTIPLFAKLLWFSFITRTRL